MKLLLAIVISTLLLHAGPPEALARAITAGDLEAMERVLSSGADPNARTAWGESLLSLALHAGQQKALDLLLTAHADPNAPLSNRSVYFYSPLLYAVRLGDLRAASQLIASGANTNARGPGGRTALHLAVESQRHDMLHLLLEKSADPNARDSEGAAPLDDAVWRGFTDAAAILLAHGAHLNEPNTQTGATPINEAAYRGFTPTVRFLLEFHPDLQLADKRGRSPLANAILMGKEDSALLLLQSQAGEPLTPQFLYSAIAKDEGSVVALLIQNGFPVNGRLPDGNTPLTIAASAGANRAIEALFAHGANPNAADANGATPLENAALKGFTDIANALIAHGAEINHVNNDSGSTALYAAAAFGRLEIVKSFLHNGADPTLCGPHAKSPYQAANENGYADVASELRSRGAVACKRQ